MSDSLGLAVWEKRWQSLSETMHDLVGRCEQAAQLDRKETLVNLLKCLRAFASGHYNFFRGCLLSTFLSPGSVPLYELEPAIHEIEIRRDPSVVSDKIGIEVDKYPLEYVFSVILDQIAYDLGVIQDAVDQRASGSPAMRNALAKADDLARDALYPAINAGLVKEHRLVNEMPTVLSYFHKSPNIRVIPYAPVALIGVPMTCVSASEDYLAIPHEIGHYVYWHGTYGNQSIPKVLDDKLSGEPKWARQWKEEGFADCYGCLIAGPAIALDFQDLQLRSSVTDFIRDDRAHPVAVLRPDIYAKVLKKRQQWGQMAEWLYTHWKERREQRLGGLAQAQLQFKIVNNTIAVVDAISMGTHIDPNKPVDKIIDDVLAGPVLEIDSDWSGDLSGITAENLASLYTNFEAYQPPVDQQPFPELKLTHLEPERLEEDPDGITGLWLDWVIKEGFFGGEAPPKPPQQIEADQFKLVLTAGGWATKGPRTVW